MNENLFQFEYFPNEILIEILQNLDIQDILRAFNNLNSRFDSLLHSLNNLFLTISKNNYNHFNHYEIPIHHISTLIITEEVYVDLEEFTHIRSLVLLAATFVQIQQVNIHTLPYLEHLSINFSTQTFPYSISAVINKIFSNRFPRLQSCYLPKIETITKNDIWSQVLSLRKLKVGKLNVFVYNAILSSCPNLYFLKFIKSISKETPPSFKPHMNLKSMIIVSPLWCSGKQSDINVFLAYVPNLEQLSIHHAEFGGSINAYISDDWLSSLIMGYLPLLRRFNYYLNISYFGYTNTGDMEKSLSQIKDDFKKVHSNQYQSRLIITQQFS